MNKVFSVKREVSDSLRHSTDGLSCLLSVIWEEPTAIVSSQVVISLVKMDASSLANATESGCREQDDFRQSEIKVSAKVHFKIDSDCVISSDTSEDASQC